jgi:hypothetical protein
MHIKNYFHVFKSERLFLSKGYGVISGAIHTQQETDICIFVPGYASFTLQISTAALPILSDLWLNLNRISPVIT